MTTQGSEGTIKQVKVTTQGSEGAIKQVKETIKLYKV